MRRIFAVGAVLGLVVAAGAETALAAIGQQQPTVAGEATPLKKRQVKAALTKAPLTFIENRGQAPAAVEYYLQGTETSVAFGETGLTYSLTKAAEKPSKKTSRKTSKNPADKFAEKSAEKRERWGLKLDFVGAKATKPVAETAAPGKVSYFKGPKDTWRTGLKTYQRLVYNDLWPGIDLVYAGSGDRLKYEFRVDAGADPSLIRMAWRGPEDVSVDKSGDLRVKTGIDTLTDLSPVTYQPAAKGGERAEVKSAFRLTKTKDAFTYGFELGSYDRKRPLVIDPATLVYAGYIGGTGFEFGRAVAVDSSGAAYVVGSTESIEASFPETVGPDLTHNGRSDAFVAKIAPGGSSLVYAGYIGGSGFDSASDVAVDGSGAAYVVGGTGSTEASFPVAVGPDLTFNGGFDDAFVAKVLPTGAGLAYAGYIGGAGFDQAESVAVDGSGAAYVVGSTVSTEASFPVAVGPDLSYNGGAADAFVAKVVPTGAGLAYAGYIGGAGADNGFGVAVDGGGAAYVTGETNSTEASFPVAVGPDLTYNGLFDAFVAKVLPTGAGLEYAGYIGGAAFDQAESVAVDGSGAAYVVGGTVSTEASFPVAVGPDLTHNGGFDAFVAKALPGGAALQYAGYIGGADLDQAESVAVDGSGAAYVVGSTVSTEASFPVAVGPDLTHNGGFDAFVAKALPGGAALQYAGYIGGAGFDQAESVAVDGSGAAYVVGDTVSTEATFPETAGPDLTHNGDRDAFVAKVSAVPIEADLAVFKLDNVHSVTAGQSVTYAVLIVNNGPDTTAEGVTITDILPGGFDFTEASPGCAETLPGSNVVTCQVGSLAPGEDVVRTITATANGKGKAINRVTVDATTPDPRPANNTATMKTKVKRHHRAAA
ncbi:hypothetical protein [Streptomyces sp. NPDC000410]|uniref:DUF7948 domain-containing protein n=1 Tax=Streptomyces sp. NPDC000410 TaxID=3154254 RepID=UPI003318D088